MLSAITSPETDTNGEYGGEPAGGTVTTNFGGNITVEPAHYYEPATEADVLAILDRHAGGTVRVVASGHAWSPAIETTDVAVRVDAMDDIDVRESPDGQVVVRAGGGAVLRDLVDAVESTTDHTLPTMGGVLKQTIAGAISTGTHGSGRSSLSHYIDEVRLAAYDSETGAARSYTFTDGDELRAARCAVGRMGVIVSVTFRCVPKYLVAETVTAVDSVAELHDRDRPESLEQAVLLPHSWRLLLFERRIEHGTLSTVGRLRAAVNSLVSLVYVDIGLHLLILAMVFAVRRRLAGLGLVSAVYGSLVPRAIRTGVTRTGPSTAMLTLHHDLFQHVEMELFIPKRNLVAATAVVIEMLSVMADEEAPVPDDGLVDALQRAGTEEQLEALRGSYIHHYPLYFRRILPDDTLISMTAGGDDPYYSLSFFTYYPPGTRVPFYAMCDVIARTLAVAFDARPHWGKHNPLGHETLDPLYPRLDAFHRQCRVVDPDDTFSNDYTRTVLGM